MATSAIPGAPPTACPSCGSPLAEDQRYCLACGARTSDPRLSADEIAAWTGADAAGLVPGGSNGTNGSNGHGGAAGGGAAAGAVAAAAPGGSPQRDWMPLIALGGLATLALVLVVGVLIGKSGQKSGDGTQVITVNGGAAPAASAGTGSATPNAAATTFTSDWPAGKDGWTIEIGSLARGGTQPAAVATARADATAKGVAAVGALDSDGFPSLPSGQYVLYSGSFGSKGAATKALAAVKGSYPGAKVVQVSLTAGGGSANTSSGSSSGSSAGSTKGTAPAKDLQRATGQDYVRRAAKAPRQQVLPGTPPPKDNKRAGGGTGSVSIG
jgi:hypothetical protein